MIVVTFIVRCLNNIFTKYLMKNNMKYCVFTSIYIHDCFINSNRFIKSVLIYLNPEYWW